MKPTKILIQALRETAQALRSGGCNYDWCSPTGCNCGQLVQRVLKLDEDRLRATLRGLAIRSWTDYVDSKRSGLPLPPLFKVLFDAGMELNDFARLEYLLLGDRSNRQDRHNPLAVARWMDDRADELEARRAGGERPSGAAAPTANPIVD